MAGAPIRFAGYAGLFDIPDAGKDTLRHGAFAQTLANRRAPVPLLWQHRTNERIGEIEFIAEDRRGLRVIGLVDRPKSLAATLLHRRHVNGLSFGYRARETRQNAAGRELLGVDLFEVSLVTHPLQHGARVHLVT